MGLRAIAVFVLRVFLPATLPVAKRTFELVQIVRMGEAPDDSAGRIRDHARANAPGDELLQQRRLVGRESTSELVFFSQHASSVFRSSVLIGLPLVSVTKNPSVTSHQGVWDTRTHNPSRTRTRLYVYENK
jgi:hypothetical protein